MSKMIIICTFDWNY